MNKVEQRTEELKEALPHVSEAELKNPQTLRKMAWEYDREGEFYETIEPSIEEANKKYNIASRLELLATAIENSLDSAL